MITLIIHFFHNQNNDKTGSWVPIYRPRHCSWRLTRCNVQMYHRDFGKLQWDLMKRVNMSRKNRRNWAWNYYKAYLQDGKSYKCANNGALLKQQTYHSRLYLQTQLLLHWNIIDCYENVRACNYTCTAHASWSLLRVAKKFNTSSCLHCTMTSCAHCS